MIGRQEILDLSREFGLRPDIVEKDYMLGWLLAGISQNERIRDGWIFKGGTCLKKCYFETYRFSEDLDFTISAPELIDEPLLVDTFKKIAAWIYEKAGIEIPGEKIRFEAYENPGGRTYVDGRIYYKGLLGFRGELPRIKLDLTADEILVLNPIDREVHHPYSDSPAAGIHIKSYGYEEIFAEKFRALGERLRPRDLYDVVHLFRYDSKEQNRELILDTLKKKCEYKKITVPTFDSLQKSPERRELESEWENMLGHQVPALPIFLEYWKELPAIFEWLFHSGKIAVPPEFPDLGKNIAASWHPPAMAQSWRTTVPIEKIRYAGSSRLCINLGYQGTKRLIEPYSLKRTKEGYLLLYAVKHDTGELRAYRVDRIQSAEVTNIGFQPKFAIELSGITSISRMSRKRARSGGS